MISRRSARRMGVQTTRVMNARDDRCPMNRRHRRHDFYKSLFKRSRPFFAFRVSLSLFLFAVLSRQTWPSASPAFARASRGCGSIIESVVVVQQRGKVTYSFATRCIVNVYARVSSSASREKSAAARRRHRRGRLNGGSPGGLWSLARK